MSLFRKDPQAVLDYELDWGTASRAEDRWLRNGDTITESGWTINGPDDELVRTSSTNSDLTTTIWLSGGTPGAAYEVVNQISTAQGRIAERTLIFYIQDV